DRAGARAPAVGGVRRRADRPAGQPHRRGDHERAAGDLCGDPGGDPGRHARPGAGRPRHPFRRPPGRPDRVGGVDRMNACRTALRVLRAARRTRTSALLTAVGVTVATSLVLLLLGLPYAVDAREARTAWQQGAVTSEVAPEEAKALIKTSRDRAAGEIIERMDIALTQHGELPPPPGVDKFPGPGESLVSPALAELIDDQPASVVGERFGKVVGVIGSDGLRHDNQLFALVG